MDMRQPSRPRPPREPAPPPGEPQAGLGATSPGPVGRIRCGDAKTALDADAALRQM